MNFTLNWSHVRRFRQIVQILALALYVFLLFAALQRRAAFPLADIFFRFDPLAALAAMLASHAWIPRLALALVTVALTVLFGRVWCGWLCPLGTLLEWVRFPSARRRSRALSTHWRKAKNVILLDILAGAFFGALSLLVLDPLALLTRSMTTVIIPGLNYAVTAVERVLYAIPIFQPLVDWAEGWLRGPVLPVEQPVFGQNVLIAVLFFGILALNLFADRFWCRYLCPLGALLGLVSKVSLLRPVVGPACNRCAQCVGVCRLGAIDSYQSYEIIAAECTVCLDCLAACPETGALQQAQDGMGFKLHWRPAPLRGTDPTRRQALAALTAGAAGVLVFRTGVRAKQPHPELVRPPGVEDESAFLARCLRCSQCMKVCPTSGLQPVLFQAGLEGFWTPSLVPRLGYCDYGCNACGQVCPSGAIPALNLDEKRKAIIGLAVIDRDLCWPWAYGIACIVCEEMCPTPEKAVRLEEVEVTNSRGEDVIVQRPYVLEDLCIGCGICEYQCPVAGEAAIRTYR
jgi:polyferredoxin/formate hydrogenlyase subunit 6/NADH:ubiquinone oxidoreductase subunit I